jgi:shikimate dehydrogenase
VGAVNTVLENSARLAWDEYTDVNGFVSPLRQMNRDWSEENAIVLGNGGLAGGGGGRLCGTWF